MSHDPVTGPLSREEFVELITAPYGEATKIIRKHDPFYQREPGEKVRWRVEASGRMRGTAYIEAADQKEADKLANELNDASFDWRDGGDNFDILSVELDK
jgi:hypothetical protein